ncbi:hypothetical protein QZH41_002231 [Actinostola sp. cb2023]|nr:hypothetical protein QZH41_002231 [Actinostola sp. cb2023]
MVTYTQRPPLHNGHLYTMATSTQQPPLHNGHLGHNGHLYTTATSTQWPPLHNGHLGHNGHLYTTAKLYTMATSTQWPPLYNGHLYTTATSTQWSPLHNGHLYTTVTSTQRSPLHNGHLYTTVTSTQRPLHFGRCGEAFGKDKYLTAALKCGEVIWRRGLLRKGYGICHGVAGNAYGLLSLYKSTNSPKYLHRSEKEQLTHIHPFLPSHRPCTPVTLRNNSPISAPSSPPIPMHSCPLRNLAHIRRSSPPIAHALLSLLGTTRPYPPVPPLPSPMHSCHS